MRLIFAAVLPLALLAACKEDSANLMLPDPQVLTEDAAGHYCQMIILEHRGPKAQVHLTGYPAPLWFSQVRDGLVYLKSPEQSAEILVLYVNDMGAAPSWEEPGETNWIDAQNAHFVVGSDAIGGMGAPELVPFADMAAAIEFAAEHGGTIVGLNEIPTEAVLSPVEHNTASGSLTNDNS